MSTANAEAAAQSQAEDSAKDAASDALKKGCDAFGEWLKTDFIKFFQDYNYKEDHWKTAIFAGLGLFSLMFFGSLIEKIYKVGFSGIKNGLKACYSGLKKCFNPKNWCCLCRKCCCRPKKAGEKKEGEEEDKEEEEEETDSSEYSYSDTDSSEEVEVKEEVKVKRSFFSVKLSPKAEDKAPLRSGKGKRRRRKSKVQKKEVAQPEVVQAEPDDALDNKALKSEEVSGNLQLLQARNPPPKPRKKKNKWGEICGLFLDHDEGFHNDCLINIPDKEDDPLPLPLLEMPTAASPEFLIGASDSVIQYKLRGVIDRGWRDTIHLATDSDQTIDDSDHDDGFGKSFGKLVYHPNLRFFVGCRLSTMGMNNEGRRVTAQQRCPRISVDPYDDNAVQFYEVEEDHPLLEEGGDLHVHSSLFDAGRNIHMNMKDSSKLNSEGEHSRDMMRQKALSFLTESGTEVVDVPEDRPPPSVLVVYRDRDTELGFNLCCELNGRPRFFVALLGRTLRRCPKILRGCELLAVNGFELSTLKHSSLNVDLVRRLNIRPLFLLFSGQERCLIETPIPRDRIHGLLHVAVAQHEDNYYNEEERKNEWWTHEGGVKNPSSSEMKSWVDSLDDAGKDVRRGEKSRDLGFAQIEFNEKRRCYVRKVSNNSWAASQGFCGLEEIRRINFRTVQEFHSVKGIVNALMHERPLAIEFVLDSGRGMGQKE